MHPGFEAAACRAPCIPVLKQQHAHAAAMPMQHAHAAAMQQLCPDWLLLAAAALLLAAAGCHCCWLLAAAGCCCCCWLLLCSSQDRRPSFIRNLHFFLVKVCREFNKSLLSLEVVGSSTG
jgi:hypothetical protein